MQRNFIESLLHDNIIARRQRHQETERTLRPLREEARKRENMRVEQARALIQSAREHPKFNPLLAATNKRRKKGSPFSCLSWGEMMDLTGLAQGRVGVNDTDNMMGSFSTELWRKATE